jgi:hypothetical protein
MLTSTLASTVLLQDTLSEGTTRLLMIFIGIAAFALLAQACAMVGMAIGASKAQKKIMGHVETINEKLLPLLDKSNVLVTDLTPQLKAIAVRAQTITSNVEEISGVVRDKVNEFGPTISAANQTLNEATVTAREANQRTRQQVVRVDGMVSGVLDAAAEMGRAIENGIRTPVREVSGIIEGVKTGIMTFINGGRRQ